MTETEQSELWLVWMWQHYALDLTEHDSRDDAISYAEYVQDQGNGWLESIEGPTGVLSSEEIEAWREARREAERVRLAVEPPRPRNTHVVELKSPENERVTYGGYPTLEAAEAEVARLGATIPAERINVRAV